MGNKLSFLALALAAASVFASLMSAWPVLASIYNLSMGLLALQLIGILAMILTVYQKLRNNQPIREVEIILLAAFFLGTWSQGIALLTRAASR